MSYIKLIARPDTWYKAGTEVFWEDAVSDEPRHIATKRRLTVVEWNDLKRPENAGIGCVGIRVTEDSASEGGSIVGEERWDGEWCLIEEFEAVETREQI